jgi:xylulokinase
MYLLGIDVGSSSIKVSLVDGNTFKAVADAKSPDTELEIMALQPGWAEQHPAMWWEHIIKALQKLKAKAPEAYAKVQYIGITYQMHGLVLTDEALNVIRPAIIWCDSRAVEIGDAAFEALGKDNCLKHFLNSPGNFTASKLKWVKENEPWNYSKIRYFMLPGDYIAAKLTGEVLTTPGGLSEGIMWNYITESFASALFTYYDLDKAHLPEIRLNFSKQGKLTQAIADELGLPATAEVTYRAGDQPNNAFALGVLHPGELAANAGTSGVFYGVTQQPLYDEASRVNTFVHVNHSPQQHRYGVLACVNGTGILNSWMRRLMSTFAGKEIGYDKLNQLAEEAPLGADGLMIFPYGNGAERTLANKNPGGHLHAINFNLHQPAHVLRATQEGIVFALRYGMMIMESMGMSIHKVKAGNANMFLSPLFAQTFADVTQTTVELFDADGAMGAAYGAAIGAGLCKPEDLFSNQNPLKVYEPIGENVNKYAHHFAAWKLTLEQMLNASN